MAFWSGERIADQGEAVVDSFDTAKIDCSAYTLTLGPECFVTPDFSLSRRQNVKQMLTAPFEAELGGGWRNIEGGSVIVPAGQFAFLLTEEFVRIPPSAMGFISLKSSVKWKGLINVSGFHVDPGFEGRLIYSVLNAGPSAIHLNRGQDLFLLWLADLDRTSSGRYVKSVRAPQVNIPSKMISDVDYPIHSLQELSDRMKELDRDFRFIRTLAPIRMTIGGILIALLSGILTKLLL